MAFGDVEVDNGPEPRRTALSFIAEMQEAQRKATIRTVTMRDPSRPEFELVCEIPTDMSELIEISEKAERAAKSKGNPNAVVITNCMTLARLTRQIRVKGMDLVEDASGSAFADPELLSTLQAASAWQAVRQLFIAPGGRFDDAVVGRFCARITVEAGLDGDVVVDDDDENPTTGR